MTETNPKSKAQMSNQSQNPNDKTYDLKERTACFGEDVIDFVKGLKKDEITRLLISQVVRSATSIGANYMEADAAESKRDFRHKIALCKKEAKETMHWLRMITKAAPGQKASCRKLWQEVKELTLIFSSILLPKKQS